MAVTDAAKRFRTGNRHIVTGIVFFFWSKKCSKGAGKSPKLSNLLGRRPSRTRLRFVRSRFKHSAEYNVSIEHTARLELGGTVAIMTNTVPSVF